MNEKIKQFLVSIGLKDTDISALQDEASDIDVKAKALELIGTIKKLAADDEVLVGKLQNEGFGKAAGSIETVIKRNFQLTKDDLAAIPENVSGTTKWEQMIKIGFEKIQKNNQSTAQELQQENQKLNAEIIELKEKKIPEIQAQSEARIKEFHVKNKISELISKHELIVDRKVAELLISDHLRSGGYKTELKDDNIEILTKDGLKPQNNDKTKSLTADEIISDVLINAKVIKQSNAGNQQQQQRQPPPQEPKFKLPGLEEANKNLERVKGLNKVI